MHLAAVALIFGSGLAMVSGGVVPQCVTERKNVTLQAIAGLGGLQTIYNNSDTNIPQVLTALCNKTDSYLSEATEIQTQLAGCQSLMSDSDVAGALQQVQIAGHGFTEMLLGFPSVDGFCVCSPSVPAAWGLAQYITDNSVQLNTSVDQGQYTEVSNVALYCGNAMVKNYMLALYEGTKTCASLPVQTKMATVNTDANNLRFKKRMELATMCDDDFNTTNWNCALDKSKTAEFKKCANAANDMIADKAICSSHDCVKEHIAGDDNCGDGVVKLFIAAVNEAVDTIRIKPTDCDSATSVRLSMIAAVVVVLVKIF